MKYTHHKLLISGDILEFDTVEKPIFYGTNYHTKPGPKLNRPTNLQESQLQSIHRSKRKVRHLVNANASQWFKSNHKPYRPIFVTLTFKLDMRDVGEANELFTDFMQRLNYFMAKEKSHELQYLAVIEFQDENREGVIHYHILFFNMKYIEQVYDEIKRIWKHGNINVESVKNIRNLANYMVKYMTKSMRDGRLVGKKKYFASRGLLKPTTILDGSIVLSIIQQLSGDLIVGAGSWQNKHCGKYSRITYNLENSVEARELVELHRLMLE